MTALEPASTEAVEAVTGSEGAESPSVDGWKQHVPGIALSLVVATAAYFLGRLFPLVGGPVFGILLGIAIVSIRKLPSAFDPGIRFSGKKLLQLAIVLLGFGLSLGKVWRTGSESLVVMLSTLAVCLLGAVVLGRVMGVGTSLTTLIGAGTGICGASAIAAVAPVIQADDVDVAYSISAVFLFNILAVLIFPAAGRALGMSQVAFGLWAGTAINDTSSVVAAAFSYGPVAGTTATVVKLARTMMIIPMVAGIAAWRSWRLRAHDAGISWRSVMPWFIVWFLAASAIASLGVLPASVTGALTQTGKFLIIVALSAIGLSVDIHRFVRAGWRPLAMGAMLWAMVAFTSLFVQSIAGKL